MLNNVQPTLWMLLSLILSATFASAQATPNREQITLRGTVQAVDATARTITIRGETGNVVTLDVPQSVERLNEVKVGDVVSAVYYDQVTVTAHPAGAPDADRLEPPIATSTPGALPGGTVAQRRVTTVTITGWDPATRVVTFTVPSGAAYARRLVETTDANLMKGLKVGDRVDVTRTEAVRLAVERAHEQAATDDDLLNRLTVSVLFGWDNQFSGKMIKEATGQTTGGAPINLDETTYDEVYGRIGMFKIGAGYRTTPRTEAVFNFVWSSSAAAEAGDPIGTVGAPAAIPLNVEFTAYKYWGIEGGQRWFFARTRFTPFVGYLVGINRHQDISGTFVNVPPNLTPGLAAQDGKFFEKSWAISLGPTGGVLVGVGPFEVMAETQFRFMGGLSDVDWLVEEGLRDVNSESSRWSIPILVGAQDPVLTTLDSRGVAEPSVMPRLVCRRFSVLRSGNGGRRRLGGLQRLVALNRVARVEQHPFATEPLVQVGVPDRRQDLGVQADQPTHDAAFRHALLALDQDLQGRVFEIGYPAHVQSQHARLVLSDQGGDPVGHCLRIQEEQAPLRPQDQQAFECLVVRVFGRQRPQHVRPALAADDGHPRIRALAGQADHRRDDGHDDPLERAERQHAGTGEQRPAELHRAHAGGWRGTRPAESTRPNRRSLLPRAWRSASGPGSVRREAWWRPPCPRSPAMPSATGRPQSARPRSATCRHLPASHRAGRPQDWRRQWRPVPGSH